ncbi:MAG: hypothetical protein RLZZ292_2806 [Bacteroidota bacterium]|jgi:hypothetical protein
MKTFFPILLFSIGLPFFLSAQVGDCKTAKLLCNKANIFQIAQSGGGEDPTEANDATCFFNGAPTNIEITSAWFKWTCETSGTLTFSISPTKQDDDVDFALYELPNGVSDCSQKQVLRCMAAGENFFPSPCMGPTGLKEGEMDVTESIGCNVGQNNFLKPLDMVQGKSYALMVNNFTSQSSFSINFGGTGTLKADLNCPVATDELSNVLSHFSIYPNPAFSEFILHSDNTEQITAVFLTNLNGQRLLSDLSLDTPIVLPKGVANGIYFLSIQTIHGVGVKKVIVQR